MAKINRYDSPAESNYFNTFVPLPLDQITALGMKRQSDLERKQDTASKYIDQASLVDYIANSKDEQWVKNEYMPTLQKYAEEAMSVDLTNPVEWAKYSTKLRGVGTSETIRRIEESKGRWNQAQEMKQKLIAAGRYNQMLDEDPAAGWDSTTGVYNYMPEAYTDKSELFEQYYKHMKPQSKGIVTLAGGIRALREGIDINDVRNISNRAAQELAATPQGQQQIKLFHKMYPEIAKDMSNVDILRTQMEDYGRQYITSNDQVLPEFAQGDGSGESGPKPYRVNPVVKPGGSVNQDILGISDVLDYDYATPTSSTDQWSHSPYSQSNAASRLGDVRNAMRADEYQAMLEKRKSAISSIIQEYPHMAYSPDGKTKLDDKEILNNYKKATKSRMDSATFKVNDPDVIEYTNQLVHNDFNNLRFVIPGIEQSFSPQEIADKTGYKDVAEFEKSIKIGAPSFDKAGGISASIIPKNNKKESKSIIDNSNEIIITGYADIDNTMKPLNQLRRMVDTGQKGRLPLTEDGMVVNLDYGFEYINGEPTFIPQYKLERQVGPNQFEPVTMTNPTNGSPIQATTSLRQIYELALENIYGTENILDPDETTPSRGLRYNR